ncbi:MAG: BRO family protein [Oscillospiraceae bacterium]|nr:BRO family protein [Oscillospiraceae bacterium]
MNELFDSLTGTASPQSENALSTYNFNGTPVRVVKDESGNPWFVAKDVCEVLEIRTDTIRVIVDDDEVQETNPNTIGIQSGGRNPLIVSESGMYSLILRSRKPEARRFKKWVTSEVLPSIRATGGYVGASIDDDESTIMARALQIANATIERNKARLAETERQLVEQKPMVDYCNDVLSASNLHTVNSIATHLGISAIRLNRFLVDRGLIYKQGDIYCPSRKIRDKGYS